MGEVLSESSFDFELMYIKRIVPLYKFIRTSQNYTFSKSSVEMKLPAPNISGGTERKAEQLIFLIDLTAYNIN